MTRTALLSGLVILGLGTMGLAQTSREPSDLPEPELQELLDRQVEMSEAEKQAEVDFLNLDLSPDVDVSSVERVPSAAQNQPNRTCEKTPEMRSNVRSPGGPGKRAYRDIAVYLSTTNVIATQDCTCAGKIIPHETVAKFEERLRKELDVDVLTPDHTRGLYEAYERQTKIVDAMCGEY
ncbi:hypothetical protein GCM10011402_36570 [Paracoccus acridae]|uniref:Uncharacterized protein n=1 Tax=Paracoccus acridae TaxID=1795310 RepID=A0ABQ1VMI4_9RHOB|nr:hypothetical protein [Paracoccus acridae]GGF80674.1 hypothetical protein GCM10011402_36570 [Paracoccus acridae]